MAKQRNVLLVCLMVIPLCIQAEVFRSVDEHGNVTYSDTPVAGESSNERVDIQAGPSDESVRDAEERNNSIQKALEKAWEERKEKQATREEQSEKARLDMEKAEANLKRAKKIGPDDRQTKVGGKSYIRSEYYERVKQAEKALKEAKKRYKAIRGY
jgi:hypothetical protein